MSPLPEDFVGIAIETAAVRSSVALAQGGEVVSVEFDEHASSSRQIFGVIGDLLKDQGCTIDDLQLIAYGCGPGSFTGVRVAVSAAQGLAYARQLPVCGVSTLEALAFEALAQAGVVGGHNHRRPGIVRRSASLVAQTGQGNHR